MTRASTPGSLSTSTAIVWRSIASGMAAEFSQACHCEEPQATKQSRSVEVSCCARLLRGACPRAARGADPWARNDDKASASHQHHALFRDRPFGLVLGAQ